MAITQPLTAFSDRVDDAALSGIDEEAPRIRKVHRALDACAAESGPQRYETALCTAPKDGEGAFYLMGTEPSAALAALFEIAEGARARFNNHLGLTSDLSPPKGEIRVIEAHPVLRDPRAPMDTFLRMLERDEATSPSSLEGLFEELEQANRDGLIELDAGSMALTDEGRIMISKARASLELLNDRSITRINEYAQEVADGRLTLREAIACLSADLGMHLPVPGEPDKVDVIRPAPDAGIRVDTSLFDPLLVAASQAASKDRAAVATLALQRCLTDWGLSPEEARSVLCHDIRCLRALGASLSHGPMEPQMARDVVAHEGLWPIVDAAAAAVPEALLESLSGPKRILREPDMEPVGKIVVEKSPKRLGFLRRLLAVLLGHH